mmetsp:Transcript_111522/g.310556  ORF Transcript_111522/g.310556 Transcript_111522/m.310556 type:complete len:397 (-) Transcript_111522:143-1333(-)
MAALNPEKLTDKRHLVLCRMEPASFQLRSARRLGWILVVSMCAPRQGSHSFVPRMKSHPFHQMLHVSDLALARRRTACGLNRVPRGSAETQEVGELPRSRLVQVWGTFGVVAYLSYGVKKVVPIVVHGLGAIDAAWQWVFLAVTLAFFGYVEGYKGFTKGFAPRVVSRAWAVSQRFTTKAPEERVWRFYNVRAAAKLAKELLKNYGIAYLLTSISLSLVSFTVMYTLVSRGVDVPALLAMLGIQYSATGQQVGTVALAYALHKAASVVRFPPTVALTPVVARLLGKAAPEDAESPGPQPSVWHKILAPAFCIGYFHGTRKRVIASWSVTSVIFLTVISVKQLANPYRAIIDAGVIVGLAWGVVSILVIFLQSLRAGKPPTFDPALPAGSPYASPSA